MSELLDRLVLLFTVARVVLVSLPDQRIMQEASTS